MNKHFTATVYILHEDKVLLLFHPKLQKWLPPGGHVEENESPPECARREVLEETGLLVELMTDEHLWIDRWNATSCERPFLCLIENIPAHKDTPAHQHIDFIYCGRPVGTPVLTKDQMRFFTLEEVLALKPDEEIFLETQETLNVVLKASFQTQLTMHRR